jgi:hypothetical protein
MTQSYLVLACERRVIEVSSYDELCAIQQVLKCTTFAHSTTTFHTEDQLMITAGELDRAEIDWFWVAGVPFPFAGNAMLIGIDPVTGKVADRPVMGIGEFRRLVLFSGPSDNRRFGSAPHGAPASGNDRGVR